LLRQVIDGRVGRLGEEVRRPLAIAAIIGQEVPLSLWAEVANLDEDALLEIVEQAVEAHLLEADRDGIHVRFVHALTREALYEGVLPPRRRLWHLRVAEALIAGADPDPDAVAYHLQEAGDPRAWEWLVQAGDHAQRAYAWLTAVERFQAAQELLAKVDGDPGMRGRLLFRLATLARFSDPVAAIAASAEAERLATQGGDATLAAEARFIRGVLLFYADRSNAGYTAMIEGIEALEMIFLDAANALDVIQVWFINTFAGTAGEPTADDERAAARLRAAGLDCRRGNVVWFNALAGRSREAAALGERVLAVLSLGPHATAGTRFAAVFAQHGLGIAYAALGRSDDARQASAAARVIFRDLGHHVLVAFSLLSELWDVVYTFGPTDPAVRRRYAAEAEAALGRAGGALAANVSPRLAWLSCLVLDGQWEEVLEILRDLPIPGNALLRREVSGPHATFARHRGDLATAWEQIRLLFPNGPATPPGDITHQEGLFLQRLAADLCLDAGDFDGARAWLEAHDRWLIWAESVLGQADGRLGWARYHRAAGEPELARGRASDALARAERPDQPLVRLAAYRLLGEIETAMGSHAGAETHLTDALDLAAACDVPFERALTLLALADLRAATGAAGEAATLLNEARGICIRIGAAPALARADVLAARLNVKPSADPAPAGLTPREVEVLRLLAQRLTDKEIAETLFLGPRTVQSHVAHIFAKLGVANRREAADEARRRGLV
jgi:DNA-binding CsgD family transcriptional regulator